MNFRNSTALICAVVLVVSMSACNWFSAESTTTVKKPKPVAGQQVEKPTEVEVIE